MSRQPASPEKALRRVGLETVQTNKRPDQALVLSPKTLALLFGEEILRFAAERAQRRAEQEAS